MYFGWVLTCDWNVFLINIFTGHYSRDTPHPDFVKEWLRMCRSDYLQDSTDSKVNLGSLRLLPVLRNGIFFPIWRMKSCEHNDSVPACRLPIPNDDLRIQFMEGHADKKQAAYSMSQMLTTERKMAELEAEIIRVTASAKASENTIQVLRSSEQELRAQNSALDTDMNATIRRHHATLEDLVRTKDRIAKLENEVNMCTRGV